MSTTLSPNKPSLTFNQQDHFLNSLMEKKIPVFIFLKSGIRLKGFIWGFDIHIILISSTLEEQNLCLQMVYKHAISTVTGDSSVTVGLNKKRVTSNYETAVE